MYGLDSTCYRGLTNPTKAGLVLGLVLASGVVAANPEFHLYMLSLPSLLEGSRHLMGDDAASTLSALVERMTFRWDMSELPESINQVSDQVAASFNSKLVPFVSQQRDHWQEGLAALSSRFDVFYAQIGSQTDVIKEDFMGKMTLAEAMVDQVLVTGKAAISQQSNEWHLAGHAKIEQWQYDLVQATDHLQGGLSQVLTNGKEKIVEKSSSSFRYVSQAKIDQLQYEFLQDSSRLQAQVDEVITRAKDAVMLKSSELQQASRMNIDQINQDVLQMNTQVQALANHLSTETKDFQEKAGMFVPQKYSEVQQLSQTKMNEVGKDVTQVTENSRRIFAKIGTEFELKRKETDDSLVPMIQDSSRLLHEKMTAFRDMSFVDVSKIQDNLAFQGRTSIDTIGDTLQKWKDTTVNQWSTFEGSVTNQVASIGRRDDSMTTESTFLKTFLDNIVD